MSAGLWGKLKPKDLPLVLSGPFLRRVSSSEVMIWLATSIEVDVEVRVYPAGTGKNNQVPPLGTGVNLPIHTIRCGKYLHVQLAVAKARSGTFPTNTLLEYTCLVAPREDLLSPKQFQELDTDKSQALHRRASVRPAPLRAVEDATLSVTNRSKRPTFVIQGADSKSLRLLYGSCRKPHGPGGDAMTAALECLREHSAPDERPHLLMLGGDQIYCDDASPLFFRHVRRFSEVFAPVAGLSSGGGSAGSTEETIRTRRKFVPDQVSHRAYAGFVDQHILGKNDSNRGDIIDKEAQFTSGHSDNHLMLFSEIAAAYVLAWNGAGEFWRSQSDMAVWINEHYKDRTQADLRIALLQEANSVDIYRGGSSAARILMANVPTYMMFDDHDVTDDWYITNPWQKTVRETPLGRRLLANAMAGYWVFQGLGNGHTVAANRVKTHPEIQDDLHRLHLNIARSRGDGNRFEFADRNILLWRHWTFQTPTRPPILALDTRTERGDNDSDYDVINGRRENRVGTFSLSQPGGLAKTESGPADLLGGNLGEAEQLAKDPDQANLPLILSLATPVFGFEPVEDLQRKLGQLLEPFNALHVLNVLLPLTPMVLASTTIEFTKNQLRSALGPHFRHYSHTVSPDVLDYEGFRANPRSFAKLVERVLLNSGRQVFTMVLSGDVHYAFHARGTVSRPDGDEHSFVQITSSGMKNAPVVFPTLLESGKDKDERVEWTKAIRDNAILSWRFPVVDTHSTWYWWITPERQPLYIQDSPKAHSDLADAPWTFRTDCDLVPMKGTDLASRHQIADDNELVTASNIALVELKERADGWTWRSQLWIAAHNRSIYRLQWVGD